ncbi:hypothetical protein BUALT_Bualt04G0155500 [Buddleja alternifolia]|uniref:Uncharacterized protein n=1 Tax=Buddleja alternifolia TaxID=168488 RepID=A0AAV6XP88_9LAMI|nr:hypothetical protein BUALT_Bualt04G0155500 [Buddleja alternifolia]
MPLTPTLKQGDDSIQTYFQKAKLISDELVAACQPLTTTDFNLYIFKGLRTEFYDCVTTLTARPNLITYSDLFSFLMTQEFLYVDSISIPPGTTDSVPGNSQPTTNLSQLEQPFNSCGGNNNYHGRGRSNRGCGRGRSEVGALTSRPTASTLLAVPMFQISFNLLAIVHSVDTLGIWHRLPVFLGLIYLVMRRHLHNEYNLFNVGKKPSGVRFNPPDHPVRTADWKSISNQPFNEAAGDVEASFFGRNILPVDQTNKVHTYIHTYRLLIRPDPISVATKLLARRKFIDTGKQFNMIAASWIQFMIHDWVDHIENTDHQKEYPELNDEELYSHARLVTSAVIAKIHTIDWTVELLKTDMLLAGMRGNWYGLLGKKFKDTFGHIGGGAILSGIIGLKKPNDHGVPYSLTEEFVAVYRMHPLLPDKLHLRNIDAAPGPNKSPPPTEEIDMAELIGQQGVQNLSKIGFTRQMVSMGHQACGALELWNYPMWLRDLIPQNVDGTDRPDRVDLAALEIYRDRERSVARYNDFRRALLLIPISKWEDLTDDVEAVKTLREVYGNDVEELDVMVGLVAEKKIKGFAISETSFIIFLLMATRRLEADRFFTSDFNEEAYTKKGLEWVNTTESLKDVLDRHYPEMSDKWMNSTSAFSVWDAPPEPHNLIPLYLRVPT